MNEVSKQDRQHNAAARARWKRTGQRVAQVLGLLHASLWLLIFLLVLRTGYLSWIGIAAGVLYLIPRLAAPLAGFAGRKRLQAFLGWLSVSEPILAALLVVTVSLWPERHEYGSWRPYRFDDELAAIEAERAVPDAENAAPRYNAVFAQVDVNDQPDYVFSGAFLRDELGKCPWRGEDHPQASQWLDSHAEIIDRLLAAGGMEKCRWPVQADIYDAYTVPYKGLHYGVHLLIAASNRDVGESRVGSALAKYFCVLRIADHLHQQLSILDSRISFGVERDTLEMIRHVLAQSSLSKEDITQIAHHLPLAADPWPQEWADLLQSEELRYMNFLARAYETDSERHVRFARQYRLSFEDEETHEDQDFGRWLRLYWPLNMPYNPQKLRGLADGYFSRFYCLPEPNSAPASTEREVGFWRKAPKIAANFHRWAAETTYFSEEEYAKARDGHAERMTRRRGTWLVLGLRCYREAHSDWPDMLDEISSYVPPEAFVDSVAGGAFVYTRDGDSFRLYSKGSNRIDEGGRCYYVRALDKVEDDIPLWPPPPPPEPPDPESLKKELEAIYGRGYERYFKLGTDGPNKSTNQSGVKASPRKEE